MTRSPTLDPERQGRIVFDLTAICEKRGYVHKTPQWKGRVQMSKLARDAQLAYVTIFDLIKYPRGLSSVSFDVLGKLCFALRCQPGDFLRFESSGASLNPTPIEQYYRQNPEGQHAPMLSESDKPFVSNL